MKTNWHASIISWLLHSKNEPLSYRKRDRSRERQWSRLANFQFLILIFSCRKMQSLQAQSSSWNCRPFLLGIDFNGTESIRHIPIQYCASRVNKHRVFCSWIVAENVQRTVSMQSLSQSLEILLRFKKEEHIIFPFLFNKPTHIQNWFK